MTEECLAELEKKWSQQFDGHEVIELIREVRRLEEVIQQRPVLLIPSDDPRATVHEVPFCCTPPPNASEELKTAYSKAHACGCHWPGSHRSISEKDRIAEMAEVFNDHMPDLDKSLPRT